MTTYKVVRQFQEGPSRVLRRGLTLSAAQAHCHDPETSSKTATSFAAQALTRKRGAWFDSYTAE
jgi:hypothetical protein